MKTFPKLALSCLLLVGASLVTLNAHARAAGIGAFGCGGCHGTDGEVSVSLEPSGVVLPGQTTTLTLTVEATGMRTMGFYVSPNGNEGELDAKAGSKTDDLGVMHSAPVSASNGRATVEFDWTPPNEVGGTDFSIHVVAATNSGGGRRAGIPGEATVSIVYGCEGKTFYADFDRDGWGSSNFGVTIDCEIRDGLSERDGDCNENSASINPGMPEVCNERDDNCNGEVDEGTEPRALHVDKDGDGYGRRTSESIMGCAAPLGFVDNADDCDDTMDTIHPGAEEVCNGFDDDCDRRVDEEVRLRCGVGLCERVAASCFTMECFPGAPSAELCNGFDDDCDGEIDNGATCSEPGHVCHMFRCIPSEDAQMMQQMPDQGAGVMIPDGMTLPGPAPSEPTTEPMPDGSPPETEPPGTAPNATQSPEEPSDLPASEGAVSEPEPTTSGESAVAGGNDNTPTSARGPVLNAPPTADTGGCSLVPPPAQGGLPALLLTLAAGLLLGRRRDVRTTR